MKKRLFVVSIVLAAAAAMSILGYSILSDTAANQQTQNLKPITDAAVLYDNAVSAIASADNLTLSISKTQETTVQERTFLEISQQTLSYQGLGTDSFCARLDETLSIDSHSVEILEAFSSGTAYVSLGDGHFSSQLNPDDYLSRFAPAILLDSQLYGTVTGVDTGDSYTITFEQPSAPETWALDSDCALLAASGTAYISYDGQLEKSIYSVSYTCKNVNYRKTVIVELTDPALSIDIPNDTTQYTAIEYFDGPRLLERATGYLLQAQEVTSLYQDSTYFQAFGDKCVKEISLYTHRDETWSARVNTAETLTNDSRIDQATVQSKIELFIDDQYSVSTNGSAAVPNPDISVDDMYSYCRNLLVGTVMLPQYIAGAQMTETDGIQRITFSGNEAFANLISSNTCQVLYNEPEMLNTLAQANNTDTLACYLEVDSSTGLPVSSGILYNGTYMIEGLPYQLQFQADQTYNLLSETASKAISG